MTAPARATKGSGQFIIIRGGSPLPLDLVNELFKVIRVSLTYDNDGDDDGVGDEGMGACDNGAVVR